MSQWYVEKSSNESLGPLRPNELLELVRQGSIRPQTRLRKNDSAWFPASEVGGLFEAASRRPKRHHCPQCNSVITKPPVECGQCSVLVTNSILRDIPNDKVATAAVGGEKSAAKGSIKSWLLRKKLKQ